MRKSAGIATRSRAAVTLMELVVVLSVLAAVSGVLVPLLSSTIHTANRVVTEHSLLQIRDAVVDYWRDTKHVGLDGTTTVASEIDRLHVAWLLTNPVTGDDFSDFDINTRIGWRGPYLEEATGGISVFARPTVIDAWNNEIAIQDVDPGSLVRDVRIVSGGPDGAITISAATATSALTSAVVGDDLYVAIQLR